LPDTVVLGTGRRTVSPESFAALRSSAPVPEVADALDGRPRATQMTTATNFATGGISADPPDDRSGKGRAFGFAERPSKPQILEERRREP
jgi:hypothetical protein